MFQLFLLLCSVSGLFANSIANFGKQSATTSNMEEKKEPESPHSDMMHAYAPDGYIKPQARMLHDPDVTFEEYYYYAQKTREEERDLEAPQLNWRALLLRKKPANEVGGHEDSNLDAAHHHTELNYSSKEQRVQILDEEWRKASRAFRTAGWGACKS